MYGNTNWLNGTPKVNGNDVWHAGNFDKNNIPQSAIVNLAISLAAIRDQRVQDFSSNGTIVGAIDGINTIFDSSQNFEPGTVEIMLNGVDLSIDDDYTETGPNEVTFVEAPQAGDKIIFRYQKLIV